MQHSIMKDCAKSNISDLEESIRAASKLLLCKQDALAEQVGMVHSA